MNRTVEALLRDAGERLCDAGIPSPRSEARILLRTVVERTAEALILSPDAAVATPETDRFFALVMRRAGREPLSRILGKREFWSLDLAVTADTLDPRPDSEAIVAAALRWCGGRSGPLRILDLGTGSGCLLLALLSERNEGTGIGTDIAAGAVATAERNAADLLLAERASFVCTDWDAGIDGAFDLIVSNPPYIPTSEIGRLEPEVSHWEPKAALDGGIDGLEAYRHLAPAITGRLVPGGAAFLEIGVGQEAAVEAILAEADLVRFVRETDLSGTIRCLGFARRG